MPDVSRIVALLALAGAAGAAHAQPTRDHLRSAAFPHALRDDAGPSTPVTPPGAPATAVGTEEGRFGTRLALGALGSAGGIVIGATTISRFLPPAECGDDPGLCEVVFGAMIGGVAGAALGAALPDLGSRCRGMRLAAGIGGAVLGGVTGTAGFAAGPIGLLTFPLGSALGAAIGSSGVARGC